MKRWTSLIISTIIIMSLVTSIAYADDVSFIEANGVKLAALSSTNVEGFVNIQGETAKTKIKLMVVRNNEQLWYDVRLINGKFQEQLWLNKGTGKYTVYVMVNEYDRKYSFGPKLSIENMKEVNEYLVPEKHIESMDKLIVEKAAEITRNLSSDREKAKAVYNWVAKNIGYDYQKYSKHQNNNYDNEYGAVLALTTGKGVCYDYAAITAALGRAAGIQTKLLKGTGAIDGISGYHAWNEMFLQDENKWVKLDTTFAAVSGENYFDSKNFDENHIKE